MSIFGWKGDAHNLSKGAFDSVSITKPGNASLLLEEHMKDTFDEAYQTLTTNYKTVTTSNEAQGKSFWQDHIKPGLRKAGGMAWELAKPVLMDTIAVLAGLGPTAAILIATAETVLTHYLDQLPEAISDPLGGKTSLVLNKGQWLFIEKEESIKRRRRLKGDPVTGKMIENDPSVRLPKAVEFGFYVRPAYGDHSKVTVFNIDSGSVQDVDVRQIRGAPKEVAEKVDSDEKLTVLRELFFYKAQAAEFKRENPEAAILPGLMVEFEKKDYMLVETNGQKALLEDKKGHTKVVEYELLTRGVSDSTPGRGDDMFKKSNDHALYSGQWVQAPARPFVEDEYGVEKELAVIFQIEKNDEVAVFYCLDGAGYYRKQKDLTPYPPNFQSLYSSKQPFQLFKGAVVEGNRLKAVRYELGSRYAQICVGEYQHTLEYLGYADPPSKKTETKPPKVVDQGKNTGKVGNNTKDKVDARNEHFDKTGVRSNVLSTHEIDDIVDEEWDDYDEERVSGVVGEDGGDGGAVLAIIAIGALIMSGFGGAMAAI